MRKKSIGMPRHCRFLDDNKGVFNALGHMGVCGGYNALNIFLYLRFGGIRGMITLHVPLG